MHFEFTQRENRCIARRLERFERAARELADGEAAPDIDALLAAAKADGKKSFPARLPCGSPVDDAIDEIKRVCLEHTKADPGLLLEACAFYLELASGRISGVSRAMAPADAAFFYTDRDSMSGDGAWLYPPADGEAAGADSGEEWLARGKFLPEELAELCGKDPVTIRIWRSKGRGGVKLVPDKEDKSGGRSGTRLMFSPQAVNDFLDRNGDLRTKRLNSALDRIAKASLAESKPRPSADFVSAGPGRADIMEEITGLRLDGAQVSLNREAAGRGKSSALYKLYLQARMEENLQEQSWLKTELDKFND